MIPIMEEIARNPKVTVTTVKYEPPFYSGIASERMRQSTIRKI